VGITRPGARGDRRIIAGSTHMQTLKHTGISNLFRCEASGIYYAIVKINGKQKHKNLRTTDKEIGRLA
jgi:hypothetical protein